MDDGEDQRCINSASTAFPENQIEVPANCEKTMTGNVQGGRLIMPVMTGYSGNDCRIRPPLRFR